MAKVKFLDDSDLISFAPASIDPPPPGPITNTPPPTIINSTVDPSATDGHHHMLFGSGNSDSGFNTQTDTDNGLQVAMKVIHRQGSDYTGHLNSDGSVSYDVLAGAQPGNAARAEWNWNYEVAALNGHTLNDFTVQMYLDTDPSQYVNMVQFSYVKLDGNPTHSGSGYAWVGYDRVTGHDLLIGDDGGVIDKNGANSQNIAFYANLIDKDAHTAGVQNYTFGAGDFDINVVGIQNSNGDILVNETMHIHVGLVAA